MRIDPAERRVVVAGKEIKLTPKEFDVSKNVLLAKLRFVETISEEDFPIMVDGPSTLAGGKVVINEPVPAPAAPPATPAPATPAP